MVSESRESELTDNTESAACVWEKAGHAERKIRTTVSCRVKSDLVSVPLQPLILTECLFSLLERPSLLQLIEDELSEILFGFAETDHLLG